MAPSTAGTGLATVSSIRVWNFVSAISLFLDAAINLVIDQKIDYGGYIPFIPSKFVYLLYTDKPIIVFARKDSWMYRLVQENPNAGIFFADVNCAGELANRVNAILQNTSFPLVNRNNIRDYFSKAKCISTFLSRCHDLVH